MKSKPIRTLGVLSLLIFFGAYVWAGDNKIITLNGGGATFPYPIYSKWFDEYYKLHPNLQINYQSIGSGGGIRQMTERTIDFGATDSPMTDEQLSKVNGTILQIPTLLGAVVLVYNLPGIKELNLTGEAIADIFMGHIKKWNDPAIAKINPGIRLPSESILVVHRADGSGTTFCFVDYLSKISPNWENNVGRGTAVRWPTGLGGKGNEGVTGLVGQMPNSIGYVEMIYANRNHIPYATVRNQSGKFIKASVEAVTAAAASASKAMPQDYRVSITNALGEQVYPISTFTWLLIYQKNAGNKGAILKGFLKWMLTEGQKMAPKLGYAPLPKGVADMAQKTIASIQ